jgi:hypothetical protein
MAVFTRTRGGVGVEGKINGDNNASSTFRGNQIGASLTFYKILVKDGSNAAVDLRGEMAADVRAPGSNGSEGGTGLAVEAILRALPSQVLSYSVVNDNTGAIHVICDGHAAPSSTNAEGTTSGTGQNFNSNGESVQGNIRRLGTAVGTNNIDVSGTTVTLGTSYVIS